MKDKKMSIRISEADLEAIHRKAEKAKLSLTDYVTRACLGRQIIVIDGVDEVCREQKAIGRNLNQLATLANMGRLGEVNLSEATARLAQLNDTLLKLLQRRRWS